MKHKLIVGNWKMNPVTLDEAKRILRSVRRTAADLTSTKVVVCPPFTYIPTSLSAKKSVVAVGAQNVFPENQGSFTGEIGPLMLKNMGVEYVIVGHSERRKMGETDEDVSKKVRVLLDENIQPILCVGEAEHDQGGLYLDILKAQIKNSLAKVQKKYAGNIIIAYEPIWAIGAKESMDPKIIHEMSIFIKKVLSDIFGHDEAMSTPILYGGSVNFRNAGDIISLGKVDGLLVGRESVNTPGFVELLKTVDII
jgi:triosephosphate isomerase